MLSHQLKQFKIDGEKTIIQNPNDAQKKEHEKFTLETHEVYKINCLDFQTLLSNYVLLGIRNGCSSQYR